MVAMVLSLVLLGGVVQIYASNRASYRVHEAVTQAQENGRFATEILSRDIRMADYWGCAYNIGLVTNNLDRGNPADPVPAGYVDFAAGGINGTEGGANSDSLVLRGGYDAGLDVQAPYGPQASSNLQVAAGNGLQEDDIVLVSDCTSADIFQIVNANPSTSGTLVHNTGTGTPGNYNASNPGCPGGGNAHCLSKVYGEDATVFKVQEISYTIANGASGQPALFRNGQELVDGIEQMQILYGEDTDDSGFANRYVAANQVSDMENVVSIRFALVSRSYSDNVTSAPQTYNVLGTAVTATDNRLRQVYTATVGVRNRLN